MYDKPAMRIGIHLLPRALHRGIEARSEDSSLFDAIWPFPMANAETVGLFSVLSADAAGELQWWRGTVRRQAAAAAPGISLAWSKLVTPSGLGGTFQRFCGRRGATPPASGFFDAPALLVRLTVVGRGC
jgi:hypothetical protein